MGSLGNLVFREGSQKTIYMGQLPKKGDLDSLQV